VLLAARNVGVKKVIFSSSCAIYGDPSANDLPIKETQKPDPQSPYATTKLMGEYYCDIFSKKYDLETVCLRYFNVYGPRQDPASEYAAVIPKFINSVKEDKPLTIYGDGKQTRDFVFVDDVVDANIFLAETTEKNFQVFNVASGNAISINDLSESIIQINSSFEKSIDIIYEDSRPGDIRYSSADISGIKTTGFESFYGLKEGLEKTNEWFSRPLEEEVLIH
jgi:UDP-glucose 4-epimerase